MEIQTTELTNRDNSELLEISKLTNSLNDTQSYIDNKAEKESQYFEELDKAKKNIYAFFEKLLENLPNQFCIHIDMYKHLMHARVSDIYELVIKNEIKNHEVKRYAFLEIKRSGFHYHFALINSLENKCCSNKIFKPIWHGPNYPFKEDLGSDKFLLTIIKNFEGIKNSVYSEVKNNILTIQKECLDKHTELESNIETIRNYNEKMSTTI